MSAFSERLKKLRTERGLTQGDLAEQVGIARNSIFSYETERRVPDIHVLANISRFFGVSSDYLIGLEDARTHEAADISARTGLSEAAVEVLTLDNEQYGPRSTLAMISSVLIEKSFDYLDGEWDDTEDEEELSSPDLTDEERERLKQEQEQAKWEFEQKKAIGLQCRRGADILGALRQYYRIHASYENEFFAISIHDGKLIKTQTTIDILRDVHHPLSFSSKEMLERIMLDRLIDTIKQGADEFSDEHPELQVRKEPPHAQEE